MTLFIVIEYNCKEAEIPAGVFSSLDAAKDAANKLRKDVDSVAIFAYQTDVLDLKSYSRRPCFVLD